MTAKANRPDLRFTAEVRQAYDSSTKTCRVFVKYINDKHELLNPCSWDDSTLSPLAELEIYAQSNVNDPDSKWYGYTVEYRPFSVDLKRAEKMVKLLRSVERKLDKLQERFGYPNDLADFCARVADAIGVTDSHPFGIHNDELTINGTHYRWLGTDGFRRWLDEQL